MIKTIFKKLWHLLGLQNYKTSLENGLCPECGKNTLYPKIREKVQNIPTETEIWCKSCEDIVAFKAHGKYMPEDIFHSIFKNNQ